MHSMHATEGKIKAYLEVWYTNEAGLDVHVASLQICQSYRQEDIDEKIKAFEEKGVEGLSPATRGYIEALITSQYDPTFKVKTIAG